MPSIRLLSWKFICLMITTITANSTVSVYSHRSSLEEFHFITLLAKLLVLKMLKKANNFTNIVVSIIAASFCQQQIDHRFVVSMKIWRSATKKKQRWADCLRLIYWKLYLNLSAVWQFHRISFKQPAEKKTNFYAGNKVKYYLF